MSNRVAVGKCINRLKKEKKKNSASHPAVLSREEMGEAVSRSGRACDGQQM